MAQSLGSFCQTAAFVAYTDFAQMLMPAHQGRD
jgi:hypothetical protein